MTDQEKAFEKLSHLKVGALFMEMGTGKTKVALDLIESKASKVDHILWVCPFSLKSEIEAERLKWHPELELNVVGCESIGSSDRVYLELMEKVQGSRTFMVVDESLKIKNRDAKRTNRVMKLGQHSIYRLILNGTPISKNVLDLWSQMEFLSPKILNMGYTEFKNTYCEYYLRGRLKGLVKRQYNIEHLISKIKPYIFDSELDLNKGKNYYSYSYQMDDFQGYQRVKRDFIERSCGDIDFMALSQMLQKFYCSSESKSVLLNSIIAEINEPVIVFVKFLSSIPQNSHAITGEVSSRCRQEMIRQFEDGKFKVLYMTYGCGAFGLNLQFCRNIIFADHTFDYAQRLQAEARIYRMGQMSDVNYYSLWCECGLENMIRGSLSKKTNLLDEIKREIMENGEEEWLKNI